MNEKVYCSECKYLSENRFGQESCRSPKNTKSTWKYRAIPDQSPSVLNETNSCKFFEKKHKKKIRMF